MNQKIIAEPTMKAYEVTITSWPGHRAIVSAESPGQAKYWQWVAADEAGFGVPFIDFRAVRAPQFDEAAAATNISTDLGWEDFETQDRWGVLAKQERGQDDR